MYEFTLCILWLRNCSPSLVKNIDCGYTRLLLKRIFGIKFKRFWRKHITFEVTDVRNIAHHLVLKTVINYKARFGSWIGRILRPKIQSKRIHCGPISKVVLKLRAHRLRIDYENGQGCYSQNMCYCWLIVVTRENRLIP